MLIQKFGRQPGAHIQNILNIYVYSIDQAYDLLCRLLLWGTSNSVGHSEYSNSEMSDLN
jgi:hypothetical protein